MLAACWKYPSLSWICANSICGPSRATILTGLGTLLVDFLVIIIALIFLLFDIAGVRQKLCALVGDDDAAPGRRTR